MANSDIYKQVLKETSRIEYSLNLLRDDSPKLDNVLDTAHRLASELTTELEKVRATHFPTIEGIL